MGVSTSTAAEIAADSSSGPTAVIYLRVSSKGQLTGPQRDGFSIETQREACEHYAASLGARIVREYVEPGKTATNTRRKALQRLLTELPEVRPTYAIFYDLSRFAREEEDAFWLLRKIRDNGSRLKSTREPVDDSPQGLLVFTVMAGVNAFRSRDDGMKVKANLDRKHADGGTIGPARIGYLNARVWSDELRREVATIEVDPERVGLVRLGFEAFSTGDHTITTVTELLEVKGLRSRETQMRPSKPLDRSTVYRMLTNDYYIGIVTRNGVKVRGRHEPIIDPATFAAVQATLRAHAASGDRSHKNWHYLTGTLFCDCGHRLGYGRHRSKGGAHYEYFSCLSRVSRKGRCPAGYTRVEVAEQTVERFYRTVVLSQEAQAAVRAALLEHVGAKTKAARGESERHARRLRELTAEQQKLVQLYYRDAVSEEVLKAEQQRIETERAEAQRWKDAAAQEVEDVTQALNEALVLIDAGVLPYRTASPTARRLINQAIYERLEVEDEEVEAAFQPVYAQLIPLARQLSGEEATIPSRRPVLARNRDSCPETEHDPDSSGSCSHFDKLAERAGFEPAMEFDPHTRLAGECLQPLGHLSGRGSPV